MIATLLKTQQHKSKQGGIFYFAFFKDTAGKSYRSCLYPHFGNFKRWQAFIGKSGIVLDGLNARGNMVDADSFPRAV